MSTEYTRSRREGQHYTFTRKTGGIYSEPQETPGSPINILARPFEAGQSLFLSCHGFHTAKGTSEQAVVTVTFRDTRSRHEKSSAQIISTQREFPQAEQQGLG